MKSYKKSYKLIFLIVMVMIIAIATKLAAPSNATAAEEIIFANGDRITGDIISLKGGTFEVEASFGRIFIPKSGIQRIEFNSYAVGSPSAVSIIKPDDLISYIQNCKLPFYIDGEKTSANNFANQIRLRWAMKMAHIKELDEFREKLVAYSPKSGADNLVEISRGKKIKVSDWLDSILKSSRRDIRSSSGEDAAGKNAREEDAENGGAADDKAFKRK